MMMRIAKADKYFGIGGIEVGRNYEKLLDILIINNVRYIDISDDDFVGIILLKNDDAKVWDALFNVCNEKEYQGFCGQTYSTENVKNVEF